VACAIRAAFETDLPLMRGRSRAVGSRRAPRGTPGRPNPQAFARDVSIVALHKSASRKEPRQCPENRRLYRSVPRPARSLRRPVRARPRDEPSPEPTARSRFARPARGARVCVGRPAARVCRATK
jgi:hypothetical protein